jgi:lysine biosynthesis protein LysW
VGREHVGRLKARCPECLAPIWLKDNVELWDPVTCPECHVALEVSSLRPLQLDYLETGGGGDGDEDEEDDEQ